MSLPRYAEYKDSGVAWLGDVPAHWSVERFKWNIERNDGGVWGDEPDGIGDTAVLRSTEQTVDGNWKMVDPAYRKLSADERTAALLESGDLLLTKSSGSSLHIGKTALVNDEIANLGCCYSNFMQRLRTNKRITPEVAWYFLNNELSRLQFALLSNSTTGLANLNGSMIGELMVAVAPREEQSAITAFLDRETGKIDVLIAEQEKLLALLVEKRQSTISHAVTRGLNPNAPMKDSGVPWLGAVPAHWELGRFKDGLLISKDLVGGDSASYTLLSLTLHGVIPRDLDNPQGKFPAEFDSYQAVRAGNLIFCLFDVEETPRAVGYSDLDGMVTGAYTVCRVLKPFQAKFVFYFYLARDQYKAFKCYYTGLRNVIRKDLFMSIPCVVPGEDEQRRIVEFIESELSKIDLLKAEAERAITLLRERRSALIAAAVTGKIDVRQAA